MKTDLSTQWRKFLLLFLLALSVGIYGCEGDDGKRGATGAATDPTVIDDLQDQINANVPVTAIESCAVCHADDSLADISEAHAVTDNVAINNLLIDESSSVKIAFEVEVDGETGSSDYTLSRIFRMYYDGAVDNDYKIEEIFNTSRSTGNTNILDTCTVNGTAGDGDPDTDDGQPAVHAETDADTAKYVFVIGGCDQPAVNSRYFVRMEGTGLPRANAVGDYPAAPDLPPATVVGLADPPEGRLLVFSETCQACHGVNAPGLHNANPFNPDLCAVCHDGRYNETLTATRFAELAHSIHRSHEFEDDQFVFEDHAFKVTFPTHMNNCSICHGTEQALDYVQAQIVSFGLCMPCHENFDGFGDGVPLEGISDHTGFTEATDCLDCHGPSGAGLSTKVEVRDFHNGYLNDPGHCQQVIFDGQDLSVVEGAKFDVQISGVTITGDQMSVSWQATYDGVAVDPCNDDTANGPVWHALSQDNQSLLRAYFQGDDIVNADLGTSPGQALSTNLGTDNTTCTNNVATSTITLTEEEVASTATKARVALQGTPRISIPGITLLNPPSSTSNPCTTELIEVRAKSPTYDYVKATGAAATPRRDIVDTTGKCLKCHVATLYQHGGNRIDNVDLCVMCHNSAANDKYRRVDYGVDASEAYDGKAGETFEMKTMLHSVHSAGVNERLYVIYRGRGIYAWDGEDDEAAIPNWPGQGDQIIFGSDPPFEQNHHFHAPTFPNRLNDCESCHKPGTYGLPDPSKAMATTLDAGAEADWGDQTDDVLQGAAAAACMSCHLAGDRSNQAALSAHASQNGWIPTTFPEGRQTIIDEAE